MPTQLDCRIVIHGPAGDQEEEKAGFTSTMFPAYLPTQKTILFPTFDELANEGNKKFESAVTGRFYNGAYYSRHLTNGYTDVSWLTITNEFTEETVTVEKFKATINSSGTYKATYHFAYYQGEYSETIYCTEYIYTFAAVENRLPTKPWTILSVVERILDLAQPIYSEGVDSTEAHPRFIVDPDQRDWLEYADDEKKVLRLSPEFTMTRCTLREQLKIVGSYIHAEPRLIHKTLDERDVFCIHFDPYGETVQSPAKSYPYVFRKKAQDINQYCTSIDSMTDNMVNSSNKGRGGVANPWHGGGLSTRCTSEYVRITDTNGIAPTDFPIQRISRVLAGAWNRENEAWEVEMTDITSYVVEATAYNANLSSYSGVYPYSKSYAIYYTMGQKNLQGLFFREPTASQVSMKCWAIVNILASVSEYDADKLQKEMEKYPFDFVFQIEYDPIYSSHIAHGKQDIDADSVDYAQINNQSENMTELSYYGENLKGIAARMGEIEEIRTCYVQKFSDLPTIGQMIDDMAISSVSYEVHVNYIKFTMALTRNFNRISQYIGINSHKRLYEVSERQAYERHILLREYGVFKIDEKFDGTQGVFGTMAMFDVSRAFGNEAGAGVADHVFARLLSKDKKGAYQLVQLPVVASAMGNVASYSWRYADNYSAGANVTIDTIEGANAAFQSDVPYGDYYGRGWWYDFAVQRSNINATYDIDDAIKLPASYRKWGNASGNALISTDNCGSLLLRKDSREALSFTVQLEFKSATPGLIIGSGLAKRLPSIAGTQTECAKIYFLNRPINKFEMRKLVDSNVPSIELNAELILDDATVELSSPDSIPKEADGYKAWVIAAPSQAGESVTYQNDDGTTYTDTNIGGGEILLAMNTPIVGGDEFPKIYFTIVKNIFN